MTDSKSDPGGVGHPDEARRLERYDLVPVNACYTTDHEMERADDGEWVRWSDIEALLVRQPVPPPGAVPAAQPEEE